MRKCWLSLHKNKGRTRFSVWIWSSVGLVAQSVVDNSHMTRVCVCVCLVTVLRPSLQTHLFGLTFNFKHNHCGKWNMTSSIQWKAFRNERKDLRKERRRQGERSHSQRGRERRRRFPPREHVISQGRRGEAGSGWWGRQRRERRVDARSLVTTATTLPPN